MTLVSVGFPIGIFFFHCALYFRCYYYSQKKKNTNPTPVAFVLLICPVLFLHSGVISGAITSQYLLEKSRIVFQVTHKMQDNNISCHILFFFFIIIPAHLAT